MCEFELQIYKQKKSCDALYIFYIFKFQEKFLTEI